MSTIDHFDAQSNDRSDLFPPVGTERAPVSCRCHAAGFPRDDGATHALEAGQALSVAAARLEWLLEDGRRRISGRFSEEDFVVLLDAFQGEPFAAQDPGQIAGALCDHLGIEPGDVDGTPVAGLVQRLAELDAVQVVALADCLERAWHGFATGRAIAETLAALGVELA